MLYFLDIEVNPLKRSICKNGIKLKTSSLNFDLLIYFLNNPNEIINREELKQHVWSGRVVSDATVYKQIKRLKQELLTNISTEELIQTVHGKGVVFVAEVRIKAPEDTHTNLDSEETIQNKPRKISTMTWMLFISIVVFINIFIFQVKSIKKENSQLSTKIKRLAILYRNDESSENTMNTRVMAQALRAQMLISHDLKANLEKAQSSNLEFNQISTNLIQKLGYNYVLDMQVSTHEFGVKAHVLLRKYQEPYRVQKFEARNHHLLLKDITIWALSRIQNIEPEKVKASSMTTSEDAFENYLAAIRADFENKPDLAIKSLKQAIAKDANFSLALNYLGGTLMDQGKLRESIKVLDKIDLSDASYRLSLSVKNNLAGCYFLLGQVNTAIDILEGILLTALELEDSDSIATILINQSLIYISLDRLDTAQQRLEQALFYIDESYQKSTLATAYLNLATVYFLSFDIDQALSYSKLSYETYILADNRSAASMALSKWSLILLSNTEFKKAYSIAVKSIENNSHKNEILHKLYALQTLITIDMEEVRYEDARDKLDIYEQQLTKIENAEVISEYLKLEYIYATLNNDLVAAAIFIDKLFQLSGAVEDKTVKLNYSLLNLDYILRTEKHLISNNSFTNLTKYINNNDALLWLAKAEIYAHNKDIEKALIFFEKVLIQFEKQNQKFKLMKSIQKYLQFIQANNVISSKVAYWQSVLTGILHNAWQGRASEI